MAEKLLDVLIVGAGPVGLFCANELIRHGLTCRIIDKKTNLSDKSKALAIHVRTQDVLQDCGLITEILAQGHKVEGILLKSHGKTLINAMFTNIEANSHFIVDLPQDKTERILFDGLLSKGGRVEWQTELTAILQNINSVQATLTREDGSSEQVHSTWLIACDGSHSTVRHLFNIPFIGAEYSQNWWLADLLIDWAMPEERMVVYLHGHELVACFPMGEKRYRLILTAPDDKEPTFEDIQDHFNRRSSDSAKLSNPIWITKFNIHHRQIQQYRRERVFFAGDAAHIHSPMGGQGLNTGIQDIYNLIWKLALVQKGYAQETILNSYHLERYPIGKEVLKKTDMMTRMMLIKNPVLIKIRNAFMSLMMSFDFIQNKLTRQMAELEISYAGSPIVKDLAHFKRLKAGHFVPNFNLSRLDNGQRQSLIEMVNGTLHHLFLFSGKNASDVMNLVEIAKFIKKNHPETIVSHLILSQPMDIPASPCLVWLDEGQEVHHTYDINQSAVILLRPDKYIGFTSMPADKASLIAYLQSILQ
ncbi:FAD-dependent oxidoreductase [Legionella oakridgensis]|uniref:Alkyl hydroperoxide reductase subunit F n=2 Tax=Legionella oakridgensis TaxID=29423 RepID=W0B5B2_9GAMM|nr:FAD-dependent monooxygenase [Legionella oakridgensis]AHE65713.1 2-polyprenyl-6-methoxyphenol hydroxylase-related FAD-dependent oxidoreductase [Legionella oakridgensis ATCC 33761 = DSM 21215]ETO94478.1 2-polyprenyl-6-methoxyphenol hydroxylase [Legionella oakridgensis RV-2-2007]KTD38210.1 FAD dependent oxidoreductase [Legionella oakridgensis]STY15660.1 FAD dependent oxidoreductase [Legionella longbeachae]